MLAALFFSTFPRLCFAAGCAMIGTYDNRKGVARVVLSVVVPSYNAERYLDKCLKSLCIPAARGRLEVLVVNDGSSDNTSEMAHAWAEREPEIVRVIDKENGGHGSAVNAGINAAHGRYLRIVDADDWLDTASLPAFLDALETATADLVVDQKFENSLETGAETRFPLPQTLPFNKTLNFADYRGDGMTEYYMLHTLSVRLPLLRALNVRLLEHTFYVDFEYILKVTSRAETIEFLPLYVYHYLVGNAAQSVAPANYVRRSDQHRRVLNECLRFRREDDIPADARDYVTRRCLLLINTHLTIHLIYDRDRRRGARNARAFMAALKASDPELYSASLKRYYIKRIAHALGVTDQTITWLRSARRKERP